MIPRDRSATSGDKVGLRQLRFQFGERKQRLTAGSKLQPDEGVLCPGLIFSKSPIHVISSASCSDMISCTDCGCSTVLRFVWEHLGKHIVVFYKVQV